MYKYQNYADYRSMSEMMGFQKDEVSTIAGHFTPRYKVAQPSLNNHRYIHTLSTFFGPIITLDGVAIGE